MRGALVLLLAADRSPQAYPTRTPFIFSTLLRLSNNLLEVRGRRGRCRVALHVASCRLCLVADAGEAGLPPARFALRVCLMLAAAQRLWDGQQLAGSRACSSAARALPLTPSCLPVRLLRAVRDFAAPAAPGAAVGGAARPQHVAEVRQRGPRRTSSAAGSAAHAGMPQACLSQGLSATTQALASLPVDLGVVTTAPPPCSVLDVCAKAGHAQVVEQLMQASLGNGGGGWRVLPWGNGTEQRWWLPFPHLCRRQLA